MAFGPMAGWVRSAVSLVSMAKDTAATDKAVPRKARTRVDVRCLMRASYKGGPFIIKEARGEGKGI
jgi:hypothetical protein